MPRTHVGLIYGGRSSEHEVSVTSARNVHAALDPEKYQITLLWIDAEGRWHTGDAAQAALNAEAIPDSQQEQTLFSPATDGATILKSEKDDGVNLTPLDLDVAFVMLHGQNGEDGRVQGLLESLGIPYTGANVLSSAACMDKEVTKRLLRDAGLPIVPFKIARWGEHPDYPEITGALGTTLFVKPANSGSSVGTSKSESEAEYHRALDEAFRFDTKVIIETAIEGREIECAVLGNEEPKTAVLGEIVSTAQFYTYDAKYKNADEARMQVPADLPETVSDRLRAMAADAYRVLGCEGMARVDFFVTPGYEVFVNEINTIPGFTERSMYPVMWEHAGLPAGELVDELIRLALDRHDRDARLKTSR